jgi:hypothetical protein
MTGEAGADQGRAWVTPVKIPFSSRDDHSDRSSEHPIMQDEQDNTLRRIEPMEVAAVSEVGERSQVIGQQKI